MSNLPENENKITENTENTVTDEFSTVFSDPAEHKKTAPEKKKNRLVIALASLLAVAIFAGGTMAVIKLIPEKEEDYTSPYLEETTVKEVESDDFDSVTVTNNKGTVKLYATREKADTSSASSSSTDAEVVNWYVDGIDKTLTSVTECSQFVGQFGTISAIREVSKTAEECGLSEPAITVDAALHDGSGFTLKVGDLSPDSSGYYCSLSDSDKIYLVGTGYVEELGVDALSFAATDSTAAFTAPDGADDYLSDEGTIVSFDSLTVKSKNFDETLVFQTNSDEELSQYMGYVVTSPSTRIAENVEYVLQVFQSGLTTSGAYSYDVSAESLEKFGLDTPDFETTMDIMGTKQTYKFALQSDGNYAVVCDQSKLISMVSADNLSSFIDLKLTDFYSSWICLYSIDDLSNLAFTVNGKEYSFDIAANEDEESEDSYVITINGEEIDCQSFQYLYQFCISLSCTDYTVDELTGDPQIVFDFTFKDGDKSVVEFTKSGETKYQYSIEGIPMGKTKSASINKFIKYLEKVAAGEIINDIN